MSSRFCQRYAYNYPLHGKVMPLTTLDATSLPAAKPGVASPWKWLFAFIGLLLAAVAAFYLFRPILVLPRIALAPGYSLVDHTGAAVSSESWRGRLTLYSFTYSRCGADCPQSVQDIAAVRAAVAAQLTPRDPQLTLVTLTVDPERDTPEILLSLASPALAEPPETVPWVFLTGDALEMKYIVGGGFRVYYGTDARAAGGVTFEPRYVLVDALGIMRAEYFSATPDPDLIVRDLRLLAEEATNSTGAARVAYEAAHLFACYPR